MATVTKADISDALSLVHMGALVNQINLNTVLLNVIPVMPGEGKVCSWTTEFTGRSDAAAFAEGADMVDGDFDAQTRKSATLQWASYRKGAKVSGLAAAVAASNYRPGTLTGNAGPDLMMKEVQDAVNHLAIGIGKALYNGAAGASPEEIVGLETAIDSTGVYATIDASVDTEWKSSENSLALASLSFDELRKKLHTPVYEACGFAPEWCVTDTATFDAIAALYGPQRRYVTEMQTARGGNAPGFAPGEAPRLIKFSAGVTAIEVDGVVYIRDRHCTASTIYGMNSRFIEFQQIPSFRTPLDPAAINDLFQRLTDDPNVRLPQQDLEGMAATGGALRPYIDIISKTGDAAKAMVKVYGALKIGRRNCFGKLILT